MLPFSIPHLTVTAVIDILAVSLVIYQILQIVRGTRAFHILVGILLVLLTYQIFTEGHAKCGNGCGIERRLACHAANPIGPK